MPVVLKHYINTHIRIFTSNDDSMEEVLLINIILKCI